MKKIPEEARTKFADRLDAAWRSSDWGRTTQRDIAKHLGISSQQVSHYFAGTRLPSIEVAKQLCEMFGCSFEWLLTGEVPRSSRSLEEAWNHASESERSEFFAMLSKYNIKA